MGASPDESQIHPREKIAKMACFNRFPLLDAVSLPETVHFHHDVNANTSLNVPFNSSLNVNRPFTHVDEMVHCTEIMHEFKPFRIRVNCKLLLPFIVAE